MKTPSLRPAGPKGKRMELDAHDGAKLRHRGNTRFKNTKPLVTASGITVLCETRPNPQQKQEQADLDGSTPGVRNSTITLVAAVAAAAPASR